MECFVIEMSGKFESILYALVPTRGTALARSSKVSTNVKRIDSFDLASSASSAALSMKIEPLVVR
jgi:hypothetical protein